MRHLLTLLCACFLATGACAEDALPAHERQAMFAGCKQIPPGRFKAICEDIVKDTRITANTKRACFEAMERRIKGEPWYNLQRAGATIECSRRLHVAGYPVSEMLSALAR
jgi:hypothetical protein